ncbi:hypothetical protein GCM10022215_37110 [Nocardioides fonticola]|uniref:Precorrin-8X methylmutase n=1 Tax=Nocardioides fonticola TaxID=450363 RepID=A0ABP7XYC1_9ACTN
MPSPSVRTRRDRCPGVDRPWPADDGLLVRLRVPGGVVRAEALRALLTVAERHGDGRLHLTSRANLQVRGLPDDGAGRLDPQVRADLAATGLLPAPRHELVRNVLASPATGRAGGRLDLRPVVEDLDRRLCEDDLLAALPGRFLFVLDDGRGDLIDRECDLGLVALDAATVQLRVGTHWGAVVPVAEAAVRLVVLARAFLEARGTGPEAPWHIEELGFPLVVPSAPDPRLPAPSGPLPYGAGPAGRHHEVPQEGWSRAELDTAVGSAEEVVVTPWRGVLVPRHHGEEGPPRRPARRFAYIEQGADIYLDSFATIRREADLSGVPDDAEKLAVRMIHGSGQVDLARDLVVHPRLVSAARAALEAGAPILCDATMVATGVTRSRLPRDNDVRCLLNDPRVPELARSWGTTRSAAAVSLWEPWLEGAVVAIGNAPTALFHLLEMLLDGAPRPAAIVGCPVGFIGAAESKEELELFAERHGIDIPFVTVRGRRGGSAMTSSALNALAQEQE